MLMPAVLGPAKGVMNAVPFFSDLPNRRPRPFQSVKTPTTTDVTADTVRMPTIALVAILYRSPWSLLLADGFVW